jgi:hypothetical protein
VWKVRERRKYKIVRTVEKPLLGDGRIDVCYDGVVKRCRHTQRLGATAVQYSKLEYLQCRAALRTQQQRVMWT